jgi:uncharacterized protein YndB with AHSA1/START domain
MVPSASVKRVVDAPVQEVWAVISDLEHAKQWNHAWDSIEITSAQRHGVGTTFRANVGEGMAFDFEVTDWSNHERLTIAPIRHPTERYPLMLEEQTFLLREAPDDMTFIELKSVASAHGVRGRIYGMFFWAGHQQGGLNEALDRIEDIVDPPGDDDDDDEEAVDDEG